MNSRKNMSIFRERLLCSSPTIINGKFIKCTPFTREEIQGIRFLEMYVFNRPNLTVEKICNILDDIQSKVFIDKECLDELQKIYSTHPIAMIKNQEETKLITHILEEGKNNYYHDINELEQFSNILNKYTENNSSLTSLSMRNKLNYVFAVDGLHDEKNYKPYVKNLSIPLSFIKDESETKYIYTLFSSIKSSVKREEEKEDNEQELISKVKNDKLTIDAFTLHVHAVRNLYEKFQSLIDPEKIKKAVIEVFHEWKDNESTSCCEIARSYKSFIGEENLDRVMTVLKKKIETIETEVLRKIFSKEIID